MRTREGSLRHGWSGNQYIRHPDEACPLFDVAPFEDREIEWHEQPFIKQHVQSESYVPMAMCSRLQRADVLIDAADARAAEPLILCHADSPSESDVLVGVAKDLPGATMTNLSATFLTRVYEGPFSDRETWREDMLAFVAVRGGRLEDIYAGYTKQTVLLAPDSTV